MNTAAAPEDAITPATVLRRFRVVVKAHPGIGMGGVASQMEIHQSTASNLVKTLLGKELISLTKAPDDRRNVRLKILPARSRLLKKGPGPFEGVLPQALGQLDAQTLTRLDQDLGALITLLRADESAAHTPLAQL
jgi:DNA-binding MarR family transcriptional regulator